MLTLILSTVVFLLLVEVSRNEKSYSRINSTKSPVLGESRESAQSRVRVDQCVSGVRVVEVPVLVCLRSSCYHVTVVGGAYGLRDSS